MNRAEQKEKRRAEILSAALDLFIRKGYAATKIQDIAGKAGMSTGLLFHYFGSKEKLYEELVRNGLSGPQSVLTKIRGEPLYFFRTAAREIIRCLKADPYVAKMFVLMSQASMNDSAPGPVKTLLAGFDSITPSARKIRKGQKNDVFRDGDPAALAVAFWGAIQGVAELAALKPGIPLPDSEWIVDMIRKYPVAGRMSAKGGSFSAR